MAKRDSIIEDAKMNAMEIFILDTLLKGKNVLIPDFGHLELITDGERRTVLLKKSDDDDLLLIMPADENERKNTDAIYNTISVPLKEGKEVSLPQIGSFRPVKRVNGDIHVSFIPSFSLRKLLNNANEEESKTFRVAQGEEKEKGKSDKIEETKEIEEEYIVPKGNPEVKMAKVMEPKKNTSVEMKSEVGRKKPKSKSISGILVIVAAILFVAVIAVTTIRQHIREKEEQKALLSMPETKDSINLPALAEQHYGNSVFWIYIYEANMDKLESPVNIPHGVFLVIPDLKKDYDVDLTDSMEIHRANMLADVVLKNIKNKTNK